ncbi:phage baseplate assembly protein V [Chloroflexota bacterium]
MTRRWWGVVPAVVTNNTDDTNLGRVKVKYTWAADDAESFWARLAGPGAGNERGLFWVPEVNDEVLVAFGHGNFNQPYVIGSLWSDTIPAPESAAVVDGAVEIRTLKTRAGHIIRLTDTAGEEKIEIIDATEDTKIVMNTADKGITVYSAQTISIDGAGSTVDIHGGGDISVDGDAAINVTAGGDLTLSGMNVTISADVAVKVSGGTAELSASGTTDVKGSVVNIN